MKVWVLTQIWSRTSGIGNVPCLLQEDRYIDIKSSLVISDTETQRIGWIFVRTALQRSKAFRISKWRPTQMENRFFAVSVVHTRTTNSMLFYGSISDNEVLTAFPWILWLQDTSYDLTVVVRKGDISGDASLLALRTAKARRSYRRRAERGSAFVRIRFESEFNWLAHFFHSPAYTNAPPTSETQHQRP